MFRYFLNLWQPHWLCTKIKHFPQTTVTHQSLTAFYEVNCPNNTLKYTLNSASTAGFSKWSDVKLLSKIYAFIHQPHSHYKDCRYLLIDVYIIICYNYPHIKIYTHICLCMLFIMLEACILVYWFICELLVSFAASIKSSKMITVVVL